MRQFHPRRGMAKSGSCSELRGTSASYFELFDSDALTLTAIATLCHDSHLENHLRDSGLAFSDGFGASEAGVRYWSAVSY